MGIRESFIEHPSGDELNIHDITIEKEERQKEVSFDPKKEISNYDWQRMNDKLEELRSKGEWHDFSILFKSMMIINPEKSAKIVMDDATWDGMEKALYGGVENRVNFFNMAMAMKIISPERFAKIDMKKELPDLESRVEFFRQTTEYTWDMVSHIAAARIIFNSQIHMDDAHWSNIKNEFERYCKGNAKGRWNTEDARWLDSSAKIAYMRIISPKKFNELYFNDNIWQRMKQALQNRLGRDVYGLAQFAAHMTIIAAEKVEVTDQGLKVTMPKKDFRTPKTPRPERRQF